MCNGKRNKVLKNVVSLSDVLGYLMTMFYIMPAFFTFKDFRLAYLCALRDDDKTTEETIKELFSNGDYGIFHLRFSMMLHYHTVHSKKGCKFFINDKTGRLIIVKHGKNQYKLIFSSDNRYELLEGKRIRCITILSNNVGIETD